MIFYKCVNGHRYGVNRSSSHCMECGAAVSSVWEVKLSCPWDNPPDMWVVRNGLSDISCIVIKLHGDIVAMMEVGKLDCSVVWKLDKGGTMRLYVNKEVMCDEQLWADFEAAKEKLAAAPKNPYAFA